MKFPPDLNIGPNSTPGNITKDKDYFKAALDQHLAGVPRTVELVANNL